MAGNKLHEEYMPLNIIELNAYEIIYNKLIKKSLTSKHTGYVGVIPMSLDLMKIFEICENGENSRLKKFQKEYPDKMAALKKTDAVINIRFSRPDLGIINHLYVPESQDIDFDVEFNTSGRWIKNRRDGLKERYRIFEEWNKRYKEAYEEYREDKLKSKIIKIDDIIKEIKIFMKKDEENHDETNNKKSDKRTPEEIAQKAALEHVKKLYEDIQNDTEFEKKKNKLKLEYEVIFRKKYMAIVINRVTGSFTKFVDYYIENCIEMKDYPSCGSVKEGIRYYLYSQGFDVKLEGKENPTHYINYKRSASKAKKGSVLFIAKELYKEMMKWTWLGLPFDSIKDSDLTSMKAYEALVMSSIVNKVEIENPDKSILMLHSVSSPIITGNRRVLTNVNVQESGQTDYNLKLLTDEEYSDLKNTTFEHTNTIWDGMALVDKSVFEAAGYVDERKQGMMLLRNSFFKACAFNTNITKYYEDNNVDTVKDMFGRELKASEIKMIVTIDSLKLDKFSDKLFAEGTKLNKRGIDSHKCMYEYWLDNIDKTFGIVKEDHESHLAHGTRHEISYQALNTLPLTQGDIEKICKEDIEYIKQMKSEPVVMANRLKDSASSIRKRFLIYNLLKYAPGFEDKSPYYTKFVDDEVDDYRKKMKKGRLKIKGDFYYLCSMPMEMLEYSVHGDDESIQPIFEKENEAYIDGLKAGDDITLLRYPHMNSGSFCSLKQTEKKDYLDGGGKYFNFCHKNGSNIVVIGPWNNNIMVKLGGADFDSDTALLIRDETIIGAVKKLNKLTWLSPGTDGLPVALADEKSFTESLISYDYTPQDMAKLDTMLAESKVGTISDAAQLCNCIMWDIYNKTDKNPSKDIQECLKKIYDYILMLSVLNELEIDRTKHNINIVPSDEKSKIMSELEKEYNSFYEKIGDVEIGEKQSDDNVVPRFLYDLRKAPYQRLRKTDNGCWDISTDYIYKALDKERDNIRNAKENIERNTSKSIEEFFEIEEVKLGNDRKLINKILKLVWEKLYEMDSIEKNNELDDADKAEERARILGEIERSDVLASLGNTNSDIFRKLISLPFAKYKSSFSGHEKGEYKNKDLIEKSNLYRYLGIVFAIGDKIANDNKKMNPAVKCIKNYKKNKLPKLVYEPDIEPELVKDLSEYVVLFGEVYHKEYIE